MRNRGWGVIGALPRARLAGLFLLLASSAAAQQGASCPLQPAGSGEKLGVVLSGGAARGLAHVGVLQVLDSLGVRPSVVVGSSMGAVLGALYAGGLPATQIDSLARSLQLSAFFRRYTPVAYLTTGEFTSPVRVITPAFVVELRGGRVRLQSPVAREPQLNALFNQLLLRPNLAAAGDFDRLPLRFRAVATDMRTRTAVELADGDLAEAIRASIAIPVVFSPVPWRGRLLVDGGLSANVPVDIARRAGATQLLVSDVGTSVSDSTGDGTTRSMLSYLMDELFEQPYSLGPADIALRPKVTRFSTLEFSPAVIGPLIDSGYAAAARALAGCTPAPARRPAIAPPAPGSEVAFIADRLARLADEGTYEAVWLRPHLVPEPAVSDTVGTRAATRLAFAPVALPVPQGTALGGVGYDSQRGARIWLSVARFGTAGGRVSLGTVFSAGEWRQQLVLAATGVRRRPPPAPPGDGADSAAGLVSLPDPRAEMPPWSTVVRKLLRPEATLTGAREVVRIYDEQGGERDRPYTRDLVLFAGVTLIPAAGQRIAIGPVGHVWGVRSAELPDDDVSGAVGLMARAVSLFTPPTSGPDLSFVPRVAAELLVLDRYHRADVDADFRLRYGDLILHPRGGAGWGEDQPLAAQFTLGGNEGFPGLRIGERRGNRAAFVALQILHRLTGPLYLRAELGTGSTSVAHVRDPEIMALSGAGSVSGVEAGLATDTPIGPFVISYGTSTTGRPIFKISVGG